MSGHIAVDVGGSIAHPLAKAGSEVAEVGIGIEGLLDHVGAAGGCFCGMLYPHIMPGA